MPELPEVEIVKQSLEKKVKNKIIQKVLVKNRNLRFMIHPNFKKHILKKRIKKIDRFSKYLIITFENAEGIIIHLGMSGTIHLVDINKENSFTNTSFYNSPVLPKTHNHVEIHFDKIKFIYNDPRRFGYFLTFNNKIELSEKFSHFGPEPFSSLFNVEYIFNYFKRKEKNIKNFLLDQKFISGIGNIYASEILFKSKINPLRNAKSITKKECEKIIIYSKLILKKAIKKGGSTIRNFQNINGKMGNFQKDFKVYQRENLNCLKPKCRGIIKKIIISNRSSFFCNYCQK
ncbi:MAG: bifunctional DNA-formamidopyrimidine glycosylase/DNA-(apurinic or apyrimidinic site) lyase [Candidatus Pelagibacter sp.]